MKQPHFSFGSRLAISLLGGAVFLAAPALWSPARAAKPKPIKVPMNQITTDGVGAKAGVVTIRQGKSGTTGVSLDLDLTGLPPGEHGFHLHEKASCDPADKEGKKVAGQAAGAHWDPDATKAHKGPGGGGHKGDLPKVTVPEGGKLKTSVPVTGLALADFAGKSLMIHAGGDNYSDAPKPSGGGGDRIICGVVPGESAAPAGGGSAVPAAMPAPAAAPAPAKKPEDKPAAKQ